MASKHTSNTPNQPEPRLVRLLRGFTKRWRGVSLPLDRLVPADEKSPFRKAEQRRETRIPLLGTVVQVTDGCLAAAARLEDVSLHGVRLGNLPEQLYRHSGPLTVFSNDNPGLPVLQVFPRWQHTNWSGKTIGARVLHDPPAWREFLGLVANQSLA